MCLNHAELVHKHLTHLHNTLRQSGWLWVKLLVLEQELYDKFLACKNQIMQVSAGLKFIIKSLFQNQQLNPQPRCLSVLRALNFA